MAVKNLYTCIDSFSGAGGLSLGLSRAGFEVVLSFDNEKLSIDTLEKNPKYFSHKVLKEDINKLLKGKVLKLTGLKKGKLFLLAGGPPCQGFSVQRIGKDSDKRNNLIFSYIDMVKELYPKFFLIENVPGINGKRGKEIINKALQEAEGHGYFIYKQILNAQDYGVPQRRKRMIVLGVRNDMHKGEFIFPKATTPEGKRKTVRDAIGFLPEPPGDGSEHPSIKHHFKDKLSTLNLKRIAALKPGQGREYLPEELLADCHKVSASVIGHRNVYGRMLWDDVSPTITARFDSFTRGMFGHPTQNRSITLKEGALLQTFPKDFVFAGNKVDVARQIGNAVPCKLAEAVGKAIMKYYTSTHSRKIDGL